MLDDLGHKTAFWGVQGKEIGFCTHCNYCLKGGGCVIKDDMQSLYPLLEEATTYIFATPVYNSGISAQLKAVMDRTRALSAKNKNVFRNKIGAAIAVGGDRSGGQELAIQQIITFYTLNGVITISGGAFGANLGAAFWSEDSLEDLKNDEEGFKGLRKVLKRLDESLKRRNNV
jgi:multimeric flavodoxin WrbA